MLLFNVNYSKSVLTTTSLGPSRIETHVSWQMSINRFIHNDILNRFIDNEILNRFIDNEIPNRFDATNVFIDLYRLRRLIVSALVYCTMGVRGSRMGGANSTTVVLLGLLESGGVRGRGRGLLQAGCLAEVLVIRLNWAS